jgi:hypothetical protein
LEIRVRRKIFCNAKMEVKYFGNKELEGKYFVILCWRKNILEIRVRRKLFSIQSWMEYILEIENEKEDTL